MCASQVSGLCTLLHKAACILYLSIGIDRQCIFLGVLVELTVLLEIRICVFVNNVVIKHLLNPIVLGPFDKVRHTLCISLSANLKVNSVTDYFFDWAPLSGGIVVVNLDEFMD